MNMNTTRRNIIRTGLLSGLGLLYPSYGKNEEPPSTGEVSKIVNDSFLKHILTFESFFRVANGFNINSAQQTMYDYYQRYKSLEGNTTIISRQDNMITFMLTLKMYELAVNHKSVGLVARPEHNPHYNNIINVQKSNLYDCGFIIDYVAPGYICYTLDETCHINYMGKEIPDLLLIDYYSAGNDVYKQLKMVQYMNGLFIIGSLE